MKVASTTSPASTRSPSLSTVRVPSLATCVIVSVSSSGTTTERSLLKKSPAPMVATRVRESVLQAPMRCGCALA